MTRQAAFFCAFVGLMVAVVWTTLAARGESPPAFGAPSAAAALGTPFGRRCIPADCVAPRSDIPDILGCRALSAGRLAALGATADFHHGLPGAAQQPAGRGGGRGAAPRSRKAVLAWADTRNGIAQHDSVSHALAVIERLGYESGVYD